MRGGISEDEKKSRARAARERLRQSAPRRKRSEGCEGNETGERIGFGLLSEEDEGRELPPLVCDPEMAPPGPPWHYDLTDEEAQARQEKR